MLKQLSSNLPYSQIYRVIVVLKSVIIKVKLINSFYITANINTRGANQNTIKKYEVKGAK